MKTYLSRQYQMIQESRQILFEYCRQLTTDDFLRIHPGFGRGGSIRNLTVHIGNTYQFWIGKHALKSDEPITAYESITDTGGLVNLFLKIDELMSSFITNLDESVPIEIRLPDQIRKIEYLSLFTHVITHEFHHKGQVLSLSRQWGYIPVDTDIIR